MSDEAVLRDLYRMLFERPMPEKVAHAILKLSTVRANAGLKARVGSAAGQHFSYMSETFRKVVHPGSSVKVALDLFTDHIAQNPSPEVITPEERDPGRIQSFVAYLARALHKTVGGNNFLSDRMNRTQRAEAKVGLGNHAYNKRFRLVMRLEDKLARYEREVGMANATQIGKAGLLKGITEEAFVASPMTAAFMAYYVARKARRSVFTNQSQSRPFDKVAEALLAEARRDPKVNPGLIARVYPEPEIVKGLSDEDRGHLLGAWTNELLAMTTELERLWQTGGIDLDQMIVQRGNDSSRWNITAQAWNAARTAWMSMLAATGQGAVLDSVCPGKVMRLMAADVAYWHRATGGDVHPDTKVWAKLPKPWDVLKGVATCTREDVEAACAEVGVDPVKSGWIEASVSKHAVETDVTPELVHGVVVSSPYFAMLMRKAGVYSGKKIKGDVSGIVWSSVRVGDVAQR